MVDFIFRNNSADQSKRMALWHVFTCFWTTMEAKPKSKQCSFLGKWTRGKKHGFSLVSVLRRPEIKNNVSVSSFLSHRPPQSHVVTKKRKTSGLRLSRKCHLMFFSSPYQPLKSNNNPHQAHTHMCCRATWWRDLIIKMTNYSITV